MESCGPRGSEKRLETSPPPPFLGLTAREDSSVSEIVDLLQVQEKKAKAGMTVPGSVSPQALGITLRIMQTLFVRKRNTRRRALLQPNKMRCTKHSPPEGSLCTSPQAPERALQSSPSLAGLPSLPTPRSPSVWFPARGELEGSSRLPGGGTVRLPGEPLLEAHCTRWSSYSALGTDDGSGGRRGRAVGRLSCGALQGSSGLAAARQALRRVELHRLPPPHFTFLPVGVGLQALEHCQALLQALCRGEQQVVVEEGADDGAHQGSDPEDLGCGGGRGAGERKRLWQPLAQLAAPSVLAGISASVGTGPPVPLI